MINLEQTEAWFEESGKAMVFMCRLERIYAEINNLVDKANKADPDSLGCVKVGIQNKVAEAVKFMHDTLVK